MSVLLYGKHGRQKIQGVALLSVLVVTAILSGILWTITYRQETEQMRTGNIMQKNQAMLYVMGMEAWVKNFLRQDLAKNNYDGITEFWYDQEGIFPVDGGVLTGYIEPLQAKYNINNFALLAFALADAEDTNKQSTAQSASLRQPSQQSSQQSLQQALQQEEQTLTSILQQLKIDTNTIFAILDWLDPDQNPRGDHTESDDYRGKNPSYRNADYAIASLDELKVVQGFDQRDSLDILERIKKYLVALPVKTPLNVNLADATLIQALDKSISINMAEEVIAIRAAQQGQLFPTNAAFYQALQQADRTHAASSAHNTAENQQNHQQKTWQDRIPAERISVANDFFMLYTQYSFNDTDYIAHSLIQRVGAGDIRILQRILIP